MIKEEIELIGKISRVVGYIPVGTIDLLRILTHPDIIESTIAYFATKEN